MERVDISWSLVWFKCRGCCRKRGSMKIILQLVVIDVVPSCNYSHIKEKEKKFKKNEKCGCNV